jgi:hypothetical protein
LGVQIIDPIAKLLACGDLGTLSITHSSQDLPSPHSLHSVIFMNDQQGVGAMAEVPTIAQAVKDRLSATA